MEGMYWVEHPERNNIPKPKSLENKAERPDMCPVCDAIVGTCEHTQEDAEPHNEKAYDNRD